MKVRIVFLMITCFCFATVKAQQELVPQTASDALEAAKEAFAQDSYHLADYYCDKALTDERTAKQAAEIKIQCMAQLRKTAQDSTRYIVALLELHDHDRSNALFNKLLMDYFTSPGHEEELRQYAHDEIRKDHDNKWSWALNGEIHMREGQCDKAIENFQHAVSIDSTFVESIYNIGVCYVNKAVDFHDSLVAKNKKLTEVMSDSVKQVYRMSLAYLEKVRELDPNQERVEWVNLLYQVYTVLDDKKAKELEEIKR